MQQITVFKIRIDEITATKIAFELFVGDRVHDACMNILKGGGYGIKGRILLTPTEFTDFATRLIAYVYTSKSVISDEQLSILWSLKLNIFDHEAQKLSSSIFTKEKSRLVKLGLVKRKEE